MKAPQSNVPTERNKYNTHQRKFILVARQIFTSAKPKLLAT